MAESLEREIEGLRALFRSERDPDGRAFVPLADAYRRNRDLDRALQLLAEGLERHPDFASAHVVSAWIHRDRGDRDNASLSWGRVLELDDENIEALKGLGTLLLESGRPLEARPYLEKARSLDPEAPDGVIRPVAAEPLSAPPVSQGWDALREAEDNFAAEDEALLAAVEAATARSEPETSSPTVPTEEPDADEPPPTFVLDDPDAEGPLRTFVFDEPEVEEPEPAALAELLAQPAEPVHGPGDLGGWLGAIERIEAEQEDEPVEVPGEEGLVPETLVIAAGAAELLDTEQITEVWSDRAGDENEGVTPGEEPSALPATRTMAELFARQGLHARAVGIYQQLVDASPDDDVLAARLEELRAEIRPRQEATSVPSVHADDTEAIAEGWWSVEEELTASPFGWNPEEPSGEEMEKGGEPISGYFKRMLAWEPTPTEAEGALAAGSTATEEPPAEAEPWLAPPATPELTHEPAAGVVPIEALAPEDAALVGAPGDAHVVPVASLAPDAVPIESLAPDAEPQQSGSAIRF